MTTFMLLTCGTCLACRRWPAVRQWVAACLLALVMLTSGCTWLDPLRGEGFQEWSTGMSSGLRGNSKNAKGSGYFFDRRAEEIEKNLGGGY
jgi:hypothetical protein